MVIHPPMAVCCAALSSMEASAHHIGNGGSLNQLLRGDFPTIPALITLFSMIHLSYRGYPPSVEILQDLPWRSSSQPRKSLQRRASRAIYKTHTLSSISAVLPTYKPLESSLSISAILLTAVSSPCINFPRLFKRAQGHITFLFKCIKPPILGSVLW